MTKQKCDEGVSENMTLYEADESWNDQDKRETVSSDNYDTQEMHWTG